MDFNVVLEKLKEIEIAYTFGNTTIKDLIDNAGGQTPKQAAQALMQFELGSAYLSIEIQKLIFELTTIKEFKEEVIN